VIDSFGNCVELYKDRDVVVAHPVEMDDADLARWQNYFATQKLKQPFEQIWEPKVSGDIKEDRYRGCLIPYYRFMSQEKRGIKTNAYGDDDYSFIEIPIKDCTTEIKRIDWEGKHDIKVTDRFEIQSIHINRLNRRTNHIICYFDKCTIYGKIEQDDESAMKNLERYTVAQIDAFLKYAIEKGSTKCTAVLLNFKNEHFEDFADVDEFTLDF
jgi:hypothetical protein